MIVYDVYTDCNPDQLTEVAQETFRLWLMFALGRGDIAGRTLAHPTGRYAASLSWQRTGEAQVSIIADESVAPEALWIETGTDGADVHKMLDTKSKTSKAGVRYRVIPLRSEGGRDLSGFDIANIVSDRKGGEKLPAKTLKIWARARAVVDSKSRFRTITDNSLGWKIDPMPAYAPAAQLAIMLRERYGS